MNRKITMHDRLPISTEGIINETNRKNALARLRNDIRITTGKDHKFNDQTANGLTGCIIAYLKLKGHQAERVNCVGTPFEAGKDRFGKRLYHLGKTTMDKGTADISATVFGWSVKIEVKIGADRLSDYQINYAERVQNAGGFYFVARDFGTFLIWYDKLREGE